MKAVVWGNPIAPGRCPVLESEKIPGRLFIGSTRQQRLHLAKLSCAPWSTPKPSDARWQIRKSRQAISEPQVTGKNMSRAAYLCLTVLVLGIHTRAPGTEVPRFGLFEQVFEQSGNYDNPYVEMSANAVLVAPDGSTRSLPLFWDSGPVWRLRFSPDRIGAWQWRTESRDEGLHGKSGSFTVVPSNLKGGIRPMDRAPYHFERQDGTPFWFLGDTAWALFTDSEKEQHNRQTAFEYVDIRASQGFNVLHSMLLSEAGWGNQGGAPFDPIDKERLNPGYWKEVDRRVRYVNAKGIVAGLALDWGDKGRKERYSWSRIPNMDARLRYARYIASRYSAFDVYFLVSGEWHAEVNRRPGATEKSVKRQFIEIGDMLHTWDPHGRMIGIHPMTAEGSVRDFVGTEWMSFGDYQQNYIDLHARILRSRVASLPIVNSEYAYFLRDQNGDGLVDKPNSSDLESIRHASWDIVMAGGYLVTGFGTTYFGGNRDPGPFNVHAEKNEPWEEDVQHLRTLFSSVEWWRLEPHDAWITPSSARTPDGSKTNKTNRRLAAVKRPTKRACWLLADPQQTYVAYVCGSEGPYEIDMTHSTPGKWNTRLFDPRAGKFVPVAIIFDAVARFNVPDARDWVVVFARQD